MRMYERPTQYEVFWHKYNAHNKLQGGREYAKKKELEALSEMAGQNAKVETVEEDMDY